MVFESVGTLAEADEPDASPIGTVFTTVTIVVMLWLARAERDTGEALGSRALIADSKQTRACWELSAAALAGLVLNAALGWWWADPVAALVISALLIRGGLETLRREDDEDEAGRGREPSCPR